MVQICHFWSRIGYFERKRFILEFDQAVLNKISTNNSIVEIANLRSVIFRLLPVLKCTFSELNRLL